jgi:hypothetical protein
LAGQTLLTALALTGLFVVAAAVSAFAARRGQLALATVLVGEFVGVLLLARADWAGAAAGLLLFFDARLPGWPLGVFGLDAAWPLAVVGTVAVVEWLTARRRLRVRPGVVFAVLAGGLTLAAVRPEDTGSLADCLTALFYGASRDGIGLGPYALHQIVFLGVPFLALWEAERSDLPRLALLAVRHGSLGPWLGRVLGRWALAGAAVVGGTVVLAAGLVAAGGGRLATAGLGPVLRQHALNGLLQVWVSTLLVLGVLLVTGSDRVAFGALAALVLLGLPQLTRGWFPAGLGMIGHLGDPSFDPAAATAVLAGTVSILALAACAGAMWRPACRYLTGRIHESH